MEKTLKIRLNLRIFSENLEKMRYIVANFKEKGGTPKYDSESHFIRCAINRLIKEELEWVKRDGKGHKHTGLL